MTGWYSDAETTLKVTQFVRESGDIICCEHRQGTTRPYLSFTLQSKIWVPVSAQSTLPCFGLVDQDLLQCGPAHTATRMWSHAAQSTSDCVLSDRISNESSVYLGGVHTST